MTMKSTPRRLIFGCGYLGSRVAALWQAAGDEVWAVTRSWQRAGEFAERGLHPVIADVMNVPSLRDLPTADTVLYAVGLDRQSGRSMREVYVDGPRHVLDALPSETKRVIYISSTGVYGQDDGSWVNEDSPCEPKRENGRVCLEAEDLLRAHAMGKRAVLLRLAGIYGPGRMPNADALLAGEPIAVSPEGLLNLIHVDDAASIVQAVADHPEPADLYTVSDGQPALRREYYAEAARLLGAPLPRFATPDDPANRAERAANRRISNRRLMRDLGLKLRYPSYKEGLAASLGATSS
jgi:nucleoside-diphosphate-sugar epimerase